MLRIRNPANVPARSLATLARSAQPAPDPISSFYTSPTGLRLHTKNVTDHDIARLAVKPQHPLTLADLAKYGRPPLKSEALLRSANFTLALLPTRLARRIQALRNLPFIVVANPHISKIHDNYLHSLSTILPWAEKEIKTLEEEVQFTEVMADLVQTHSNTISTLARGFFESRKYTSPREVTKFLEEHLRTRIGTRLIAEQHIALHLSSSAHNILPHEDNGVLSNAVLYDESPTFIGVVDTKLRPESVIRHCEAIVGEICELKYGVRPTVKINGDHDYTFAHIPVHLEYIITELLKNAFRATVERGMEREPIEITIAPLPENASASAVSAGRAMDDPRLDTIKPTEDPAPGVTIRIRDRGGGISPENYPRIWDYSFTTFNDDQMAAGGGGLDTLSAVSAAGGADGMHSLAGLGYGLPLGRAYAEYFGGGIAVQSMWGWGTDVYLKLKGVGNLRLAD